jgi:hypothetical protein
MDNNVIAACAAIPYLLRKYPGRDLDITVCLGGVPSMAVSGKTGPVEINMVLDYETMYKNYVQHGVEGVYAYLLTNKIALDSRHGDFIINKIFLPEVARRTLQQALNVA